MVDDKIIDTIELSDYEIWTDTGWQDITHIHKTKKFDVWRLETENYFLEGADEHIVIKPDGNSVWICDLVVGDWIQTESGPEQVTFVGCLDKEPEHMYDVTVDSEDHTFYSNGILSHNTTVTSLYLCHYILFNQNKNAFVLANKEMAAHEVIRRVQEAYTDLPLWLQSGVLKWAVSGMTLENGCRLTAAATTPGSISGQSVNLLYVDEFSKIPNNVADDFIASTFPVISSGKTSKIVMTMTPFGMNHGYEFWKKAVQGDSRFYPIKVNWWEHPGRDDKWKKNMIKDIGLVRWNQEFGLQFAGSTDTLIDSDILESQPIRDPIAIRFGGLLKVFELPITGYKYVIGVDTSRGMGGADNSTIQVLKIINTEDVLQVASYAYNSIRSEDFAEVCVSVAKYYNHAMLVIENNYGEVAEDAYYTFEYENVYAENNKKMGIFALPKSKMTAVLNMQRYFMNGWLRLMDKDTVKELSNYGENKKGSWSAMGDNTDDRVSALYWALYYLITPEYREEYDPSFGHSKKVRKEYDLTETQENDAPMPMFFFD